MATRSADSMNHLQEASMSHFIKTQLMAVLQPFIDHVEENDKRIAKLEDVVDSADDRIVECLHKLDATNATVKSTMEAQRQTDRRVEATGEGLHKCADHMDQMQRGLQFSNEYAERIHNQARGVAAEVPELRRCCDEVEKQLQALQVQFQRLSDGVMAANKLRLDSLAEEVMEIGARQAKGMDANDQLRLELQEESRLLHDARQELQKSNSSVGAVQQTLKDVLAREKELGGRLEGWKAQWNKLQPSVDGLKKDVSFLKQHGDSHDASIHGLQRGQQTIMESFEDLHSAHAKMGVELDTLQRSLKTTNGAVSEAQDHIGQNTSFANGLHARLDQSTAELSNMALHLKGLDGKHQALCDVVDRATDKQDQLLQDNRKAASDSAAMQRELEKTNDNLSSTTKQMETVSRGLQSTKGELGHATDRVAHVESTLQALQGAFVGLQKGFVDSTHEMGPVLSAKKMDRLPKLGHTGTDPSRPVTSRQSMSRESIHENHAQQWAVDGPPRSPASEFSTQQSVTSLAR